MNQRRHDNIFIVATNLLSSPHGRISIVQNLGVSLLFRPAPKALLSSENEQLNEILKNRGWTLHDVSIGRVPEVRFKLGDGRIYGFPTVEPGSEQWPAWFAIADSSPAVRACVLGSNWQSQLIKAVSDDRSNRLISNDTQEYIPRPPDPFD